jgi:hypothetical protein
LRVPEHSRVFIAIKEQTTINSVDQLLRKHLENHFVDASHHFNSFTINAFPCYISNFLM